GNTGLGLGRCYPRGLDVMSVLGSTLAEEILADEGDTDYVNYAEQLQKLKEDFAEFDVRDWNRNLYWGWLYTLRPLLEQFGEGYPAFMQTDAWAKKELNAALASWTELRHDTILYAKQSYTVSGTAMPAVVPGYVEPVPEFYGRLLALTRMTRLGLATLEVLSADAEERLLQLEGILGRLLAMAEKELAGQALSEDDCWYIKALGHTLEYAVMGVEEEGVKTTLVADVHTHGAEGHVLEEGVGYVDAILVVCPHPGGKPFLAVGPVFSYYEFKHPMADRLTDEAWRDMLAAGEAPERAPWYQEVIASL
ncbi:MAG TPA: DUF3160 domain-containing protein, partial [Candidatus Hydrogenedentes bacterium]|nr:DUF3160 domain-containing protein [Candidatus Hydrogenedentota bacterium]